MSTLSSPPADTAWRRDRARGNPRMLYEQDLSHVRHLDRGSPTTNPGHAVPTRASEIDQPSFRGSRLRSCAPAILKSRHRQNGERKTSSGTLKSDMRESGRFCEVRATRAVSRPVSKSCLVSTRVGIKRRRGGLLSGRRPPRQTYLPPRQRISRQTYLVPSSNSILMSSPELAMPRRGADLWPMRSNLRKR